MRDEPRVGNGLLVYQMDPWRRTDSSPSLFPIGLLCLLHLGRLRQHVATAVFTLGLNEIRMGQVSKEPGCSQP